MRIAPTALKAKGWERVTRLELATSSLARRCSTTELHPRLEREEIMAHRLHCATLNCWSYGALESGSNVNFPAKAPLVHYCITPTRAEFLALAQRSNLTHRC